jgi:putative IMPACT (imprinted ancient) family translation regulator
MKREADTTDSTKTENLVFRVTHQEKALLEKCAKKYDISVSRYIRNSMLMEMMLDGEMEAFKILVKLMGSKAVEAFKRKLQGGAVTES